MSNIITDIKLSGVTYQIQDATAIHSLDGYYTSGQTNDAITAATTALAETIGNQHYQTSGDVQSAITEATSGINNTLTAHTADTTIHVTSSDKETWNAKADISDIPSVSGYADAVKYNSTSKYVEFYHGGTGGTKVFEYDASPFLIDGMVQNVEIKDVTISGESVTCLVISFNTDAGKQDINIPISEIFDASNYYTTAQTDSKIAEATSGKADTSAVTASIEAAVSGKADTSTVNGINNTLTAHTANTDIHVTTTDKTTWSGKQDALVSGTNIKTIGGNSLLGSGNIDWPAGMTAQVSGTTLIFS